MLFDMPLTPQSKLETRFAKVPIGLIALYKA